MDTMIDTSYANELIRIGTFVGWPGYDRQCKVVKPTSIALARSGFYFTGISDEVVCYSCGLRVRDWEQQHDPLDVHASRSPRCPVLSGRDPANSPLITPDERERKAIQAMLKQAGHRVISSTTGNYPASSLIAKTLVELYGEGMMRSRSHLPPQASAQPAPPGPALAQRGASAAIRQSGRGTPPSPGRGLQASRPPPVSSPAGKSSRRSSASESESSRGRGAAKPPFLRTRSESRTATANSETIANRQNSNPPSDHTEYQESEEARLSTFNSWVGVRGASAQEFAQAGFIFIGAPDRVQCVFCNGILRNWNDNDRPIEEHRKHFPTCSFVTDTLSAITVSQPRHTNYCTLDAREKSFLNWSSRAKTPSPEELAKAGFFYVGHGDNVKCFFCDGGLRNWEPNDDPWREHARWFRKCDYVRQSKGQPYVDAVTRETQDLAEYQTASVDDTAVKNLAASAAAAAATRTIDPREVTARLDSEIVKAVLRMDVPRDLVKKAIRKRLAEDGEDFSSATDLLEAVFELDPNDTTYDEVASQDDPETTGMAEGSGPPSDTGSGNNTESLRLMEENRQLKEQKQCKICMDEEVCVAFLPCGHLVCCSTCAPALNACPICRAKIRGTVRTYMA